MVTTVMNSDGEGTCGNLEAILRDGWKLVGPCSTQLQHVAWSRSFREPIEETWHGAAQTSLDLDDLDGRNSGEDADDGSNM